MAAGGRPTSPAGAPSATATRAAGDAHHGGAFSSLLCPFLCVCPAHSLGGSMCPQRRPTAGEGARGQRAAGNGRRAPPPWRPSSSLFHTLFCSLPSGGCWEAEPPWHLSPATATHGTAGWRPAPCTLPPKGILSFRRWRMHRPCSSSPCLLWMLTGIERNGRGRRRRTLPVTRGQPVSSFFVVSPLFFLDSGIWCLGMN
jgi:hypothetical protein